MLLYLLSSDELRELLDRLGYRFEPEQIPTMVDYYLARTSHGSTLSGVVHTWVLARANRDRALEFFEQALTVRHRRHPGRHHLRGHSSGRDGRQRGPHPALLHRVGDSWRSDGVVTALAGITWCAGLSDPLPWPPCARAGQWQRRRGQRGSARCPPNGHRMPRPGRTARAGMHDPVSQCAFLSVGAKLRLARDDHRHTGRLNNPRTDGTQQHAGEAPKAGLPTTANCASSECSMS